jgi:hypothetical protein
MASRRAGGYGWRPPLSPAVAPCTRDISRPNAYFRPRPVCVVPHESELFFDYTLLFIPHTGLPSWFTKISKMLTSSWGSRQQMNSS